MKPTLPQLSYAYTALEPFIDAQTMEIHHTKHHQAYIDNYLKAVDGNADLLAMDPIAILKDISVVPDAIRQTVINNLGGHVNHSMFWETMTPKREQTAIGGELKTKIEVTFGSFEKFQEAFTQKALTVFGSGWAFLVVNGDELEISRHSFQNSPYMQGLTPLLGIDVWEHAYYLKYQNRKAEYISAWWNVVNWKKVESSYALLVN